MYRYEQPSNTNGTLHAELDCDCYEYYALNTNRSITG